MKTNKLLIISVILLILIAALYLFSNSKGTLKSRNTRFLIKSTENISEIRISSDKEEIILNRENSKWKINGLYSVNETIISNFLSALSSIEIVSPVSKVEKNQIGNLLKTEGIRVEIKKNNFRTIRFYVNKPTMSKDRTYMMMQNSLEPYSVKIPQFEGLVSQLFISNEDFWRDKIIFNYMPQNIKTITVEYPQNMIKSFRLSHLVDNSFTLQNNKESKPEPEFNLNKLTQYFTYFHTIEFERIVSDLSKEKVDSINGSIAFSIISVEDYNGELNSLKLFRKPAENSVDEFGNKAGFDYNKAYAVLNDNHEILEIHYYNFDLILKEIDYFR